LHFAPGPGPVKNVTVEQRQGSDNITAVLSWQPPDEPNGIITQYQVLYAGYNGTQVYAVAHSAILISFPCSTTCVYNYIQIV